MIFRCRKSKRDAFCCSLGRVVKSPWGEICPSCQREWGHCALELPACITTISGSGGGISSRKKKKKKPSMTNSPIGVCASGLLDSSDTPRPQTSILRPCPRPAWRLHRLRHRGAVHGQSERSSPAGRSLLEPGPGNCPRLAAGHPDLSRFPPAARLLALAGLRPQLRQRC